MASRKMTMHCRIMVWLDQTDADLAGAIRDLCLEGSLSARRSGVTFLYPSKAVREKIVKDTYTEKAEKAADLVSAHIIPMCLKSGADFNKGKIGSKKGVLFEVESASGSSVTLKGGAKLAPAKGFSPLGRDDMAVWEVTSGEVPLTGPAFEHRAKRKTGGDPMEPSGNVARQRLYKDTINKVFADWGERTKSARVDTPALEVCVSLLRFLANNAQKYPADLARVLAVVSRDALITLTLVLEPFRDGDFYLSEAAFGEWYSESTGTSVHILEPSTAMEKAFDHAKSLLSGSDGTSDLEGNPKQAAIFSDPQAVYDAVRQVADQIEVGPATFGKVKSVYASILESNRVGSVSGVFPDDVKGKLQNGRKLWQDGLRYQIAVISNQAHNRPAETSPAEIFNSFWSLVSEHMPGKNFTKEVDDCCGIKTSEGMVRTDMVDRASFCIEIVRSDAFFSTPRPGEQVAASIGGDVDQNPYDRAVWVSEKGMQAVAERSKPVEAQYAARVRAANAPSIFDN